MRELISKVWQWADARNLISGATSQAQMLKMTEEVGELAHAVARNDKEKLVDAIGDCMVVLIILAAQNHLDVEACLESAYEQIKDRKGKMSGGIFIKEEQWLTYHIIPFTNIVYKRKGNNMSSYINITGKKINRLKVLDELLERNKHNQIILLCECECGKIFNTVKGSVLSGSTKSCGCLQKEKVTKHNMEGTPEYKAWISMRNRCNNPNYKRYQDWGGRGIKVCERWNSSFENFYSDMGKRPDKCSLDRIDNSKGYNPENCRWSTMKEQCSNRRSSIRVFYNGNIVDIKDYAELIGLSESGARKNAKRKGIITCL